MFISENIKIYLLEAYCTRILYNMFQKRGFICTFKLSLLCAVQMSMLTDRLNEHIDITIIYHVLCYDYFQFYCISGYFYFLTSLILLEMGLSG